MLPTLVVSFSALLVAQTARSQAADGHTHTDEDGKNRPEDASQKCTKFAFFVIVISISISINTTVKKNRKKAFNITLASSKH